MNVKPQSPVKPDLSDEELRLRTRALASLLEVAMRPISGDPLAGYRDSELLIVDEADRLKTISLEQLRYLFDRGQFGLVLIGMPGIEKRLARYPQLYSRIGFVHHYRPLPSEELRQILLQRLPELVGSPASPGLSSPEVLAAILRITNGNLRLVVRLLTQIARILEVNATDTVTAEIVDTAREVLVIGNA